MINHLLKKNIKRSALFSSALMLATSAISLTSTSVNACPSMPMYGAMCAFGGNFTIRGWYQANGALLPIASNTALFSLIGTTFGGDGRSTFGLPDLRGRTPMGVGSGPGLSTTTWGQRKGSEYSTLSVSQIPQHSHSVVSNSQVTILDTDVTVTAILNAQDTTGNTSSPSGTMLANNSASRTFSAAAPDVNMSGDSISSSLVSEISVQGSSVVGNAGANNAHENRMPYMTINWLISAEGIYPSRS